MKIKLLLIAIISVFCVGTLSAQEEIFEKLSDEKDISVVIVSKALLSMAPSMDMGNIDIGGLAKKLEGIQIYTCEERRALNIMRTEIKKLEKDKKYEVMMRIKNEDENIAFYARKEKDRFKDLIMYIEEDDDEGTIVRLLGDFTAEDVQVVMKDIH